MVEDSQHYLWVCLDEYRRIGIEKYRRDFDWISIENRVKQLDLISKRGITYVDLQFFQEEAHWPFDEFPALPPEEKIRASLDGKVFDFAQLPKNEATVIRGLLKAVRSIELVSVILRFIKPQDYGIMSPPVEKILEVSRGENVVKTYLKYLRNLRQIKTCARFPRVADVDMALWVLHSKCFGPNQDPEFRRNYLQDKLLRAIRIKNLVSPLPLNKVGNAQLAETLLDVKPNLATLIACYELETLIRRFAELKAPIWVIPETDGNQPKLSKIIKQLFSEGFIEKQRRDLWFSLKIIRDDFFHKAIEPGEKTNALVEEVAILEEDIAAITFMS